MDDWERQCRQAAIHCLEKAKIVSDPGARGELLMIAQRWLDMSYMKPPSLTGGAALRNKSVRNTKKRSEH